MTNVVATAEDLVDYLDLSLGFVCKKIEEATPSALKFSIGVGARHRTW